MNLGYRLTVNWHFFHSPRQMTIRMINQFRQIGHHCEFSALCRRSSCWAALRGLCPDRLKLFRRFCSRRRRFRRFLECGWDCCLLLRLHVCLWITASFIFLLLRIMKLKVLLVVGLCLVGWAQLDCLGHQTLDIRDHAAYICWPLFSGVSCLKS